jgi:hypothetical protein
VVRHQEPIAMPEIRAFKYLPYRFCSSSTGIRYPHPANAGVSGRHSHHKTDTMDSRKRKQPEPLAIRRSCDMYQRRDGRPSSKAVRFQSTVSVHLIPRHHKSTWLSRAELSEIKRRARTSMVGKSIDLEKSYEACCFAINQSHDEGTASASICTHFSFGPERGLERWASLAHYRARAVQVLACKTNLFIEQSNQLVHGKRDEEKLAAIYCRSCRASQLFAQMLGRADVAAADYV